MLIKVRESHIDNKDFYTYNNNGTIKTRTLNYNLNILKSIIKYKHHKSLSDNNIMRRIKNNMNLSTNDKNYLWAEYPKYVPKTKRDLECLIGESLKEGITNLNYINTSYITDMSSLFHNDCNYMDLLPELPSVNISDWDVSNVEDMSNMFYEYYNFNCDLSKWNVHNVTDMSRMFSYCYNFNSDLSNWNVSKVKHMNQMFYDCYVFDSNLNCWDVSNVGGMTAMFYCCRHFNSCIKFWDVHNVEFMDFMFYGTTMFNQDLSIWDVSKVRGDTTKTFMTSGIYHYNMPKFNRE